MATEGWPTKRMSVTSLQPDAKNPRLGRERSARTPREIIRYLFEHDKAIEVAESIATRGYFANEPLLVVEEEGRYLVVEGNRRLAALKALRDPSLLEGSLGRRIERLARRIPDIQSISKVPVTIAPNRRATDRQLAGRHVGTPVLAWQSESRASFILEKLEEGYDNDELRDDLGFTLADIQQARQTRAIADMARSIVLPEAVKLKLESPRAKVLTTIERVFNSTVGREFLRIEPDPEHGLRGTTTKAEFIRGFTKLVTDIALGDASSRTLNSNEDIEAYFTNLPSENRPAKKRGSFFPEDVISRGADDATNVRTEPKHLPKKTKPKGESLTILPRDLKLRFGNDRLRDIHRELVKLKRKDFPNAGAVLLRVFFELSVLNFLSLSKELPAIISRIEKKEKRKLPFGAPTLRQLIPEIVRVARDRLSAGDATTVEKAVRPDASAPFTVSDLHGFVHTKDMPGEREILQFWLRTEPLLRVMLEDGPREPTK